jgi:hypothetical protein
MHKSGKKKTRKEADDEKRMDGFMYKKRVIYFRERTDVHCKCTLAFGRADK